MHATKSRQHEKPERYGKSYLDLTFPPIFPFLPINTCSKIYSRRIKHRAFSYERHYPKPLPCFPSTPAHSISVFFQTKEVINMYKKNSLFRDLGGKYMANIGKVERLGESCPAVKLIFPYPCSNGQARWKPLRESSDISFQENSRF